MSWTFASPAFAEFRFVSYRRVVTPELLGRFNAPELPWFELTEGTVWHRVGGGLEAIGPEGTLFAGGAEPHAVSGLVVGDRRFISVFQNDRRVMMELIDGRARGVPELTFGPSTSSP